MFERLLSKVEEQRKAYGGKVFDVLGAAFEGTPRRDLTDPPRSTVEKTFPAVGEYYGSHRIGIDGAKIVTFDFTSERLTKPARRYPPTKIIDMIFFEEGATRLRDREERRKTSLAARVDAQT